MCSWGCLGLPSTIKETKITKQSNSSRLLLKRLANKQWLKQDKCCNTVFLLISSVQSLSSVWLFVTPWTAARQASLSITNPEFTQTHVHQVGDAIQPFHPLSSPSPPALNLSPSSGSFQMSQLFTSGSPSIGVSASTSVLPMNTQDWFPLEWTGWISLQSKGLSRVLFNTTVQKHQFFCAQLSL